MLNNNVTVFKDDNYIAVGNDSVTVDTTLPANIRCIQWDGINQVGDIEYSDGTFNKTFYNDEYEAYVAPYVVIFNAEKERLSQEEAEKEAARLAEYNKVENVYSRKFAEINAGCQEALNSLTLTYPDKELLTFDKQEQEARAYLAGDISVSTDHIKAIAEGRGIPLDTLVSKIIAKANAFSVLSGMLIGLRQKYEDQLEALDKSTMTKEDIDSIVVSYELPEELANSY